MKKVLFIDRDGTIILEPPLDFQVDSLEKLEFYPKVLQNLAKIVTELDYELVMVTNQDGLGTDSFPEEDFNLPHDKMMKTLENENIIFSEILLIFDFEESEKDLKK
jgi:imidazoleglycerol-phosphate dehydratase/histidinol-phosphatase